MSATSATLRKLLGKNLFELSMISSEPAVQFYDPDKPICISLDASKNGIGSVLLQKNENDCIHV